MAKRIRGVFLKELEFLATPFARYLKDKFEADEKERARVARNRAKASRLLGRIERVRAFDIWEATKHIDRNFYGENDKRNTRVKQLYAKKNRIEWMLTAIYKFWAFDETVVGFNPRLGLKRWSRIRKKFLLMREEHHERVLQIKWDIKRQRVRAARARKAEKDAMKDILKDVGGKKNAITIDLL